MFIGSQVFIQWKLHSVRRTEVEVSTGHECLLGKELPKEKLDGASSKRGVCDFRPLGEINKLVEKGSLDYHGAPPRGGIGGGGFDSPTNEWTGRKNKHGEANTGGGGAAANGNGGPGILIVRYKTNGGPTGS